MRAYVHGHMIVVVALETYDACRYVQYDIYGCKKRGIQSTTVHDLREMVQ